MVGGGGGAIFPNLYPIEPNSTATAHKISIYRSKCHVLLNTLQEQLFLSDKCIDIVSTFNFDTRSEYG